MTLIIALSGRKGAGKNTLADFICKWMSDKCEANVRQYSFADYLKQFCIDVLGLSYKQCYGTDEEKNTPTGYRWENTPVFELYPLSDSDGEPKGPMTGRDVMQVFGTECVRSWFGNVWAEATIRRIQKDNSCLALITDNRFPSEVKAILDYSYGYVIRLTRTPFGMEDQHASESSLDSYDWNQDKCFVLDNSEMSIDAQNKAIVPILEHIYGSQK